MAGPGLGFLAGLLSGAGGFPKGMQEETQNQQRAAEAEALFGHRNAQLEQQAAQHAAALAESSRASLAREKQGADTLAESSRANLAREASERVELREVFEPVGLGHLVPETQIPMKPPSVPKAAVPSILSFLKPNNDKAPTTDDKKRQDLAKVLKDRGYVEDTPEWNAKFLSGMRYINVPEGARIEGLDAAIPFANGKPAPGAPSPSPAPAGAPKPFGIEGPLKPPDTSERKDIAALDTALVEGGKLLQSWHADPNAKPSWGARMLDTELPLIGARASDLVGGGGSSQQRMFMANVAKIVGEYRRALSGLAVTDQEAQKMLDALPRNNGAVTLEQLQSLHDYVISNRERINATLVQSGRKSVPLPETPMRGTQPKTGGGQHGVLNPAPTQPKPVEKWGRDASGKLIRIQ